MPDRIRTKPKEDETMTTLVRVNGARWTPFREMAVLQNELSRLMNGLVEGNGRQTQSWVPTLDAWETEDDLVYALDLPGVPQDAISVEVEDGVLTVSAERTRSAEVSEERYHRLERRYGTFARSVGLPQGVAEDAITASYKDGVLELHIPKPELPKPRKIEISLDGSTPATIEGTSSAA
jgi:HSP20 family protein